MRDGLFAHRLRIPAAFLVALLTVSLGPGTIHSHGETDQQIARLTQLIENDSSNPVLFWQRGELCRFRGNWDAAVADFEIAAGLDPLQFSAAFGRALIHLDRGKPEDALRAVDRHLERHPNSINALFIRAQALADAGRIDEAARGMNDAIERTPDARPDAWLTRARWLAMCSPGGIDRAIASLDKGMERIGPVVTLQLYAVDLELARGSYDGAIRRLDTLIPTFQRRETLLARKGEILELAGMRMDAIVACTEALDAIDRLPDDKRATANVVSLEADVHARLSRLELNFRKGARP